MNRRWCVWAALLCGAAVLILLLALAGAVAAQSPTPGAKAGGGGKDQKQAPATPAPAAATLSRGPGAFDLAWPSVGLAGLPGYVGRLEVGFQGTEDGQPVETTEVYTLTFNAATRDRLLLTETRGPTPGVSIIGGIGGVMYVKVGEGGRCQGSVITDTRKVPLLPLTQSLPPVLGAEDLGKPGTVQGVAARGYRFDQRALNLEGVTTASGEVWVAATGGAVLRYTLRLEGTEAYFGEGRSGSQTLTYTLSDFAKAPRIDVPAGCPPVLTGAPLPDDAAGVVQRPGYTRFTTGLSLKELAAFYTKALVDWKARGAPFVGPQFAQLDFGQPGRRLTITASVEGKVTAVRIYLSAEEQAAK